MHRVSLLFAGLSLCLLVSGQTPINQTDYFESQTWTQAGSPYLIQNDLKFWNNSTLTIEAGVEVIFQGYYRLEMYKSDLIALGTAGDSILFTVADTTGFGSADTEAGGWAGLEFNMAAISMDTSRLSHCRFEYCKVYENSQGEIGTISAYRNSRVLIENSLFIHNRARTIIECGNADIIIRNNVFRHNRAHPNPFAGSIIAIGTSSPLISMNTFEHNTIETIIRNYTYSPLIERNVFRYNRVKNVIKSDFSPRLLNNKVYNNTTDNFKYALDFYGEPYLENNLVANNSHGGIFASQKARMINNTIVNNGTYGLNLNGVEEGLFSGNIIFGNDKQVIYYKGSTEPGFRYNCIENGIAGFYQDAFTGEAENNISTDPVFISPTAGTGESFDATWAEFGLYSFSPCINNGDPGLGVEDLNEWDLEGRPRIRYGRVDIGAYESSIVKISLPATVSSDTVLVADSIYVDSDVTIEDDVIMTISGGSNVVFRGPYKITNNGTIVGLGTEHEPVVFTVEDNTGFWGGDFSQGGWKGIVMDNSSLQMDDNPPSAFHHCVFEYAKDNQYNDGSAFYIRNIDSILFDHCIFRYNRSKDQAAAIYARDTRLFIRECLVDSNIANTQQNCDGPFYFSDCKAYISGSTFRNNRAHYGAVMQVSSTELQLENCRFYNNLGWSGTNASYIMDLSSTECNFVNCQFANNLSNYVLYLQNSTGSMTNCNIVNNVGGVLFDRGHMVFSNCIYHGNRTTAFGSTLARINLAEDSVDPDFYNCLVETGTGVFEITPGFMYSGEFMDCIDGDPDFVMPTPGRGLDPYYDYYDWRVLDISPAINAGLEDAGGLGLPETDLGGNSRVLNGRIDIGAYENEVSALTITRNPVGGNFCEESDLLLSVDYENSDTARFQWILDGQEIPGAVERFLDIRGLTGTDEGSYVCRLSNAMGSVNSAAVLVRVNKAPEILIQPQSRWVQTGKQQSLKAETRGSEPLAYQWQKDGVTIPGAGIPEYNFTPTDSSFEGMYTFQVSNPCGTASTDSIHIYLAPELCMVTVSPTTGHNLVVWEKKTRAPLMAYNIYRESIAAGIYDLLETVPFDELSVYVDTNADPTVQAYLYKMTAIDTSGYETDVDLCTPHKTIHLIVSTNPELNTTQLQWDRYYGFDYQTYTIYRSGTGSSFDPIHSLSASLNSWTDPSPLSGDMYYRMAVEKPSPCVPEGGSKKAGTGPYQHSLSNMDDNKLKSGENPPDSIMLDNHSIDENKLPGNLVGRFSTRDADSLDYHTYHLVSGEGDQDNGSFAIMGDLLISALSFDYETRDVYSIRVRSTDNAAIFTEENFTIHINDTEETPVTITENPPDSILLNNHSIAENNLVGDMIGRLSTRDIDSSDVHSYQLVAGEGDDDNSKFLVLGDLLLAAYKFDFEDQSAFSVRIRSTDLSGNTIENSFTVIISDEDETVGFINPEAGKLLVYPNPFRQTASIVIPDPGNESYTLRIVDLTGKTVYMRKDIHARRFILSKGELSKGYYLLFLDGPKHLRQKLIIE